MKFPRFLAIGAVLSSSWVLATSTTAQAGVAFDCNVKDVDSPSQETAPKLGTMHVTESGTQWSVGPTSRWVHFRARWGLFYNDISWRKDKHSGSFTDKVLIHLNPGAGDYPYILVSDCKQVADRTQADRLIKPDPDAKPLKTEEDAGAPQTGQKPAGAR